MKTLLADSIMNLCKSSLHFSSEMSVEALVGVTLDKQNILLMNINKSISCDNNRGAAAVKKEDLPEQRQQQQQQQQPNKRKKKGSSPSKRKSPSTAPPNKVAPPPNQSLDMYHRPWDQGALAPNVTIKSEPVDTNNAKNKDNCGTLPHSELRAHLESGVGPKMAFQQTPANGAGLFVNGLDGNAAVNQMNGTVQFGNSNAASSGVNASGTQGSSLNTRSALFQVSVNGQSVCCQVSEKKTSDTTIIQKAIFSCT